MSRMGFAGLRDLLVPTLHQPLETRIAARPRLCRQRGSGGQELEVARAYLDARAFASMTREVVSVPSGRFVAGITTLMPGASLVDVATISVTDTLGGTVIV